MAHGHAQLLYRDFDLVGSKIVQQILIPCEGGPCEGVIATIGRSFAVATAGGTFWEDHGVA